MNTQPINSTQKDFRLTTETILPQTIDKHNKRASAYNIYPYHSIGNSKIFRGYQTLSAWIAQQTNVVIDGGLGVFWDEIKETIDKDLAQLNLRVNWIAMPDLMKSETEIQKISAPFMGTEGSVWGTKANLQLVDFFDATKLSASKPNESYDINIAIGVGAGLLKWDAEVVYLDVPKNELQFRMRAEAATNLGITKHLNPTERYKRLYFVDWVVLNAHKKAILPVISVMGDTQWAGTLNWMFGNDLKAALKKLSESPFRVRPWFEPGAWGGRWMQEKFHGLNKEAVNYAWSYELMVLENGIVLESDGNLLEVSFDSLMFSNSAEVLGRDSELFGDEFPIRFDFLDTFDGGNLSIQCHPSLEYIRKHFGEKVTQDETYYILDCKDDAKVYLGFREDIEADKFRKALETSRDNTEPVEIEEYVQVFRANKHDLFLIPNGTVHSSGINNMVLEISASPYIFTFKMYDWLSLDLSGKPRPINIEHAFHNLNFERKGEKVKQELISEPKLIDNGEDWEIIHYPTHREHSYDIHRLDFESQITVETGNVCHVLMLVEGTSVSVLTANGASASFSYGETFIIPAAAENYTLVNTGNDTARVIKAFVKEDAAAILFG